MRVRFVSPWYPDYARAHSGIFVANQVDALRDAGHEVTVETPQIFPAPPGPIPGAVIRSMRALATHSRDAMFAESGGVTYVPTPVPARGGYMGRALAMSDALSLFGEFRDDEPDLVHAHLGIPTAWAVTEADSKSPLVVTEHQSTLAAVFAERSAMRAYAETVHRADAFICVSEHLREQVADGVGEWAREKIEVIPNIVDLADIPLVERPRPEFSSWIYVGGLMPHKGVPTLLRTFAEYARLYDESARLTLVGDGPLENWIREFTTARGLEDSVVLAGTVPHSQLGSYLAEADVMVQLSPAETFGIAPLEGIGSGLPVVSLRNIGAVNAWGDIEEQCGLLVPLNASPSEIASAISDLRDSPGRLRPEFGRETVNDRYSPHVIVNQLVETYERVLDR